MQKNYKSKYKGTEMDASWDKANTAVQDIYVGDVKQEKDAEGNVHLQGGGGTSDYEDLENKPSINGVELIGSLIASDLDLASNTALETETERAQAVEGALNSGKQDKLSNQQLQNIADVPGKIDKENLTQAVEDVELNTDDGVALVIDIKDTDTGLGDAKVITLPTATEDNAGVMSAETYEQLQTVESIAKGANQAITKDTLSALVTWLNSVSSGALNNGQIINIVQTDVPDFWISGQEQVSVPYTYTTDDALINAVIAGGGKLQVGYYLVSFMETQKVDLTNYYNKAQVDAKVAGADKIFDATYNVTTYQQIIDARDAGKTVRCYYNDGGIKTTLWLGEYFTTQLVFTGISRSESIYVGVTPANVWGLAKYSLETLFNRKTSMPATPDDSTYLTSKAVADYVAQETEDLAEKTPIVTPTTGQATYAIDANKITKLGELEDEVEITLNAGESGKASIYDIIFSTGATAPTITWPTGITWMGGSAPTINASKTYEISISESLALISEF